MPIKYPIIWATFVRIFVAKNFQKSPNLVTLYISESSCHVIWPTVDALVPIVFLRVRLSKRVAVASRRHSDVLDGRTDPQDVRVERLRAVLLRDVDPVPREG